MVRWLRKKREAAALEEAPYPIHARTMGMLGTPREPITWFVCNNGHRDMGTPWSEPERECFLCRLDERETGKPFSGWSVADEGQARAATVDAIGPSDRFGELWERTRP